MLSPKGTEAVSIRRYLGLEAMKEHLYMIGMILIAITVWLWMFLNYLRKVRKDERNARDNGNSD